MSTGAAQTAGHAAGHTGIVVEAFGGPDVMQVRRGLHCPEVGPSQVRIALDFAGVNPVDTYIRGGAYGVLPSLPYTPGFDGSGVIEAVDAEARSPLGALRVGQRVWVCRSVTGTYASACVCEGSSVCAAPDGLSGAELAGVGVPCMTAALALLVHARAQRGERVLVHGASGAVGLACVQMARGLGCEVWGTASTQAGQDAVRRAGAHEVFEHASTVGGTNGGADGSAGIEAMLRGQAHAGVHVVIEMLANVNLQHDTRLVAKGGRIVVVGSRGELAFNPRGLMSKDARVTGMSLMNANQETWALAMRAVDAGLRAGTLRPVVGLELPLADAPRAHELVMQQGKAGKIVLRV
jgi:NADPH2:quinone reductase